VWPGIRNNNSQCDQAGRGLGEIRNDTTNERGKKVASRKDKKKIAKRERVAFVISSRNEQENPPRSTYREVHTRASGKGGKDANAGDEKTELKGNKARKDSKNPPRKAKKKT